jgi:hypothetical protein
MLFEGQQLREIIGRTPNEIELRNAHVAFDFCAVARRSLRSTPEATQRSA